MAEGDALRLRTDDGALKEVTVTVTASTTGTSSADPELVGGRIVGAFAKSGVGQIIAGVALGATGIVTVTMASSDTGVVTVIVLKSNN